MKQTKQQKLERGVHAAIVDVAARDISQFVGRIQAMPLLPRLVIAASIIFRIGFQRETATTGRKAAQTA